ncbi:MAG: ABC transporter ATP-binding protein [Eubacteriales bacterium]
MLEFKNVSFAYKNCQNIYTDFSYRFDAGKLYAVTGASGRGKSTLLFLAAGFEKPTRGAVEYNGRDIAKIDRSAYRARSIGVVFQSYNLLMSNTAADNVVMALYLSQKHFNYSSAYEKALEMLAEVGIDREKSRRGVLELSGGEQQRVALIRAAAGESDILLADEPTGNLDADNHNFIMRYLRRQTELGKTVIIATHNPAALEYADFELRI